MRCRGGCNYHYCTHALLPSGLEFLLSLVTMITMATLVLHFYVQRVRCINILLLVKSPHVIKFSTYSLKFNCIPDTKLFTAIRRNFTFLSLLLFLELIILVPIGYSITRYVYGANIMHVIHTYVCP